MPAPSTTPPSPPPARASVAMTRRTLGAQIGAVLGGSAQAEVPVPNFTGTSRTLYPCPRLL